MGLYGNLLNKRDMFPVFSHTFEFLTEGFTFPIRYIKTIVKNREIKKEKFTLWLGLGIVSKFDFFSKKST